MSVDGILGWGIANCRGLDRPKRGEMLKFRLVIVLEKMRQACQLYRIHLVQFLLSLKVVLAGLIVLVSQSIWAQQLAETSETASAPAPPPRPTGPSPSTRA